MAIGERAILTLWLLCVLLAPGARASAFLMPEGRGQAILTTTFADARRAYDARGRLVQTPHYGKFETRAWLEYGLNGGATLVGEASAMDFQGTGPDTSSDTLALLIAEAKAGAPLYAPTPGRPNYQGLGLGAVGLRLRLLELANYVVSVEASLRAASPGARIYLDMKDQLQADARLQLGRTTTLFGMEGFVDLQLGYRSRGQSGDEARLDITYGLRPCESLLLLAQTFSAITPRAAAADFLASQKFQLSGVYYFTPEFALQLGATRSLAGANAPVETGIISAIWVRY